jgi:hypothetical protein
MPLELVRRMLRHRDARSTERYAKLADASVLMVCSWARERLQDRVLDTRRAGSAKAQKTE